MTVRTGPIQVGHEIFSVVITPIQIMNLVDSVVLVFVLSLFIQKTKMENATRAVADDPVGASVVGIYPEMTIHAAFAIGSAAAGIAGILISLETNIEPTMGFSAILKGMIASIIGGIGSTPGAMVGGFFLGIVENPRIWKIQAGWKDTISFAVLILFLLFRPGGIFNVKAGPERV
jgi:branched-chain amino acid transport system permease protein